MVRFLEILHVGPWSQLRQLLDTNAMVPVAVITPVFISPIIAIAALFPQLLRHFNTSRPHPSNISLLLAPHCLIDF